MKKNNVVFEFLGFGSPRAVVVNFSLIFLALAIIPTAFWDWSPDLCIWHRLILPLFYGDNCPASGIFKDCHIWSCGLTHAASALLHGQFAAAYEYNKLVYALFAVIVVLIVYNLQKLKKAGYGK